MALIHLQDAPTVAPSSSPGNDYDNVQTPAAAFGAATAQAGQRFGGDMQQAGQNVDQVALLRAERDNQVATDAGVNTLMDFGTSKMYGGGAGTQGAASSGASTAGGGGTSTSGATPGGFLSLHGQDAIDAGDDTLAAMQSKAAEIKAGLPSDQAKLDFDRESRRFIQLKQAEIGQHLDVERDRVNLATYDSLGANARQAAANAWNSDETFGESQHAATVAEVKSDQLKYGVNLSPELMQAAQRRASTGVVDARVRSWAENDPSAALQWLQHGTMLGPNMQPASVQQAIDPATYDGLVQHLIPAARAHGATVDADRIFNGGAPVVRGDAAMTPTAIASIPDPSLQGMALSAAEAARMPVEARAAWISAIHNESQWNPAVKDGTSGEIGIGQVMPETGAGYGYTPQQLRVPATNLMASARIFTDGWRKSGGDVGGALRAYNGGSPNSVAAQPYADRAMQRMQGWVPGGAAPAAPAPQGPSTPPATAPQPGTPAYTAHADERFPPPGASATQVAASGSASRPDATNEFPGVPTAPSIGVPSGGGYAPGGPVPVPTPDSPHDTPAAQRAGVPAPGIALPATTDPGSPAAAATPTAPAAPATPVAPPLPGRPPLETMLAQADVQRDPAGVDDLAYRQTLKSEIRARYAQQEFVDRDKQKTSRDTLLTAAMGGNASPLGGDGSGAGSAQANRPTSLDQLLSNPAARSAYLDAGPEVQRSILGILEHNAAGVNPPENNAALSKYYTLRGMSAESPDDFKNTNLADPDLMNTLPHNLLLDLMNRQASMSASDAKSQQRGISLLHAQQVIAPDARQAGLTSNAKPGSPAADTWAQFTGRLDDALQRYQQDNGGKRPTDDELKKIGGSLLTQGWLRGTGSLWGTLPNDQPTRLFQAQTSGKTAQFYPAVPPADRQQITEGFKAKMGRAPTDAELQQLYMMGRQPMQGRRAVVPPRASPQPGTAGAPSLPMAKQDEGQPAPAAAPAAPGAPPPAPAAANSAGLPVSLIPGGF
jgi:hypothetical protein